ncbi:hypothetical protein FOL47_005494 [Perkinsus chesapeaki]|uniref:Uncharacterized protein n=1 Tax=Perkinsus chesapeaki TaxID=330153 RepID=A0A7J6LX93_PERCH|nr:hypothetical protein FOL47_005494 [Perkinsus chesapeaki]
MLSTNYGAMAEIKRPPSDDEPSFKRARIGPDHERRDRESDRSSLDGDPLTDSPTAVSTGVVKLEFIPPAPTEEGGTEDLFYMGREPATPAQLRVLLRECIVDLLVTRGKTTADGTRYIAHGDLIFNFFDEINLRGGVKLRDLVPKDEASITQVSQKNLSSLPGITIQQIDGACVCYRLTAFDATNRLRCMLKRWEATAGQVALARSAVDYIKQVTGTDAFPLGAFALGIANRDDDLLRVAMANDDVLSSKLQLICAAEANGWSITRISKRDCCPAYSVPRLTIVQEDQVPCYMTVEIPHLDFHVEIRFVTECGAMAEMQRLKHEIMDAEPELLLLAKVLRRLVRQPCRSNEVDATHISMLLVRSFYISTAYRGMGLYQDYVDLLYFFGEEEEIGDSLSEWSCSDDSLAGEQTHAVRRLPALLGSFNKPVLKFGIDSRTAFYT